MFSDISIKPQKFEAELAVTRPVPEEPVAAAAFDPDEPPFTAHISAKSLSSLDAYRRAIQNYYGKDLEWERLLPRACRIAEEAYKAAPTDLDPTEVELPNGSPHLLDVLLPEDELSVVFGLGEAAKSLSVLGMCMAMASRGGEFAGYEAERASTLWIDYENPTPGKLALRMNRIILGQAEDEHVGYVPGSIRWMPGRGIPLPELVPNIKRALARLHSRVVVVDSAGPACGGNALDQEVASRTTNALLGLGVTVVLIAHTNKGEDDRMPFGSAFWHYAVHGKSWFLKRTSDADTDEITIGWYCRKVSDGRRPKDFAVKAYFDAETGPITFARADINSDVDLRQRAELGQVIPELLKHHGAMTNKEIAEELSVKWDSVRKVARRLETRGVLVSVPFGKEKKWGLVENRI